MAEEEISVAHSLVRSVLAASSSESESVVTDGGRGIREGGMVEASEMSSGKAPGNTFVVRIRFWPRGVGIGSTVVDLVFTLVADEEVVVVVVEVEAVGVMSWGGGGGGAIWWKRTREETREGVNRDELTLEVEAEWVGVWVWCLEWGVLGLLDLNRRVKRRVKWDKSRLMSSQAVLSP